MAAETFGDRVKKVRDAAGLTQAAIERELGKAEKSGFLSAIEAGSNPLRKTEPRGKRPNAELIEALVRLAGASRDYLLTGNGPMFDTVQPLRAPFRAPAVLGRGRAGEPVEPEDQFPSRAQYIAANRDVLDEYLIGGLRKRISDDGKDPGWDFWKNEHSRLLRERKSVRAMIRAIEVEED